MEVLQGACNLAVQSSKHFLFYCICLTSIISTTQNSSQFLLSGQWCRFSCQGLETAFSMVAPLLWNALPKMIHQSFTLSVFTQFFYLAFHQFQPDILYLLCTYHDDFHSLLDALILVFVQLYFSCLSFSCLVGFHCWLS